MVKPLVIFFLLGFSRKFLCLHWFDFHHLLINPTYFGAWINSFGITHNIWCFHWDLWIHTLDLSSFQNPNLSSGQPRTINMVPSRKNVTQVTTVALTAPKEKGKRSKHPSLHITRPTYLNSMSMTMKTHFLPSAKGASCWTWASAHQRSTPLDALQPEEAEGGSSSRDDSAPLDGCFWKRHNSLYPDDYSNKSIHYENHSLLVLLKEEPGLPVTTA